MHFAHRHDGGANRRDGLFALKEIGTRDGLLIALLSCKTGTRHFEQPVEVHGSCSVVTQV